jgi:hypothetical protein
MGDVHIPIQPFGLLQCRSIRLLWPGSVPEASMTSSCLLVATEAVTMTQYILVVRVTLLTLLLRVARMVS